MDSLTWKFLTKNFRPIYVDNFKIISGKTQKDNFNLIETKMNRIKGGKLDFLNTNGSDKFCLDLLIELIFKNELKFILQYSIDVTYSKKYPLVLLRYKNDAKDSDLTRICRGLIIEKFTNKIIAFPMNKFSNSTLHLEPAYIMDKIDGSCAVFYCYDSKWNVSTSRNPDGDSLVGIRHANKIVFSDLFWNIFYSKGYTTHLLDVDCTFTFEIVSPLHQIIIHYPKDDIFLLSIRNIKTLIEVDIREQNVFKIPNVLTSHQDNLNEGTVCIYNYFGRLTRSKNKNKEFIQNFRSVLEITIFIV